MHQLLVQSVFLPGVTYCIYIEYQLQSKSDYLNLSDKMICNYNIDEHFVPAIAKYIIR